MNLADPILITGAHRSGTTWVGGVLRQARQVAYIPDTFQINGLLMQRKLFRHWFKYITEENEGRYLPELRRLFRLRYLGREAIALRETFTGRLHYGNSPDRLKFYAETQRLRLSRFLRLQPEPVVPLLKDPVALFSTPWLARRFGVRPVIMIRHPAAFFVSLRRVNWRFDFRQWTDQPLLMRDFLAPFEERFKSPPEDHLSEACLMWNAFYATVDQFRSDHPGWTYLRHEDASREPLSTFQSLYKKFDLPMTRKVETFISQSTSGKHKAGVIQRATQLVLRPAKNLLTRNAAHMNAPRVATVHRLKRDSMSNIKVWQQSLTSGEIDKIRTLTEPVANLFYDDDDW